MLAELGWLARLELPRLSRRKGRALMASLLGRDTGPDLAERVFRRSEGNPLFLEKLLRSDRGAGEELPESLRDLVLADVERLSAQAQDVLEALAVAGQWCGHGLLAAATGIGDRELPGALRPAVSANALVPEGDGYAFPHALIREAILEQVLPGAKTRLHVRVADQPAAARAAYLQEARHASSLPHQRYLHAQAARLTGDA